MAFALRAHVKCVQFGYPAELCHKKKVTIKIN